MALAQIVKWGNSLAIRIPKLLAEEAGMQEGDPIMIEAKAGHIQVSRSPEKVPTLREFVAQISAHNRYGAIETGRDRGNEKVEW